MEKLCNLPEEKIVDTLIGSNQENDYHFNLEEISSILKYTIRKATGIYETDADLFIALLKNEFHDYVMRKRFNDKEEREAKRCVSFAIPTRI